LQYDIYRVGAVRYPEYGPRRSRPSRRACVRGVLGLASARWWDWSGIVLARDDHVLRRVNSRIIHAGGRPARISDPGALVRVHVGGLLRDALRRRW